MRMATSQSTPGLLVEQGKHLRLLAAQSPALQVRAVDFLVEEAVAHFLAEAVQALAALALPVVLSAVVAEALVAATFKFAKHKGKQHG